jgi:hypothetical protein
VQHDDGPTPVLQLVVAVHGVEHTFVIGPDATAFPFLAQFR